MLNILLNVNKLRNFLLNAYPVENRIRVYLAYIWVISAP